MEMDLYRADKDTRKAQSGNHRPEQDLRQRKKETSVTTKNENMFVSEPVRPDSWTPTGRMKKILDDMH